MSNNKRDPSKFGGLYRGAIQTCFNYLMMYTSNYFLINKLRKRTPDYLAIPLSSLIVSTIFYPVDSFIKLVQIEGFLGRNDLIIGPDKMLQNLKNSDQIPSLYNGLQYFFLKTLIVTALQFQFMKGDTK